MGAGLHKLINHPWVSAFMGVLLIGTGLAEAITPFLDQIKGNEGIGAHHGVTVYGFYLFLRSLGEVFHGKREVAEGLIKVVDEEAKASPQE